MPNTDIPLISRDNCPPELVVIEGGTAAEFLRAANGVFPCERSPVQAVIWLPDEELRKRSMAKPFEEVHEKIRASGYEHVKNRENDRLGVEKTFEGRTRRTNTTGVTSAQDPLLMNLLHAASDLTDPNKIHFKIVKKRANLTRNLHFDPLKSKPDRSYISALDVKQKMRDVRQGKKFMRGKSCRLVWNDAVWAGENGRIGTILACAQGVRETFNDDKKGQKLLRKGHFKDLVSHIRRGDFHEKLSKLALRQVPNHAVSLIANGDQWSAKKYSFHSWASLSEKQPQPACHTLNKLYLNTDMVR
jgi:hypothetical protein